MAIQLITYDLRKPGRSYKELYDEIQKLGSWWHCVESVWLVDTIYSCGQIRDHLKKYVDTNDDVAVLGINSDWATWGLSDECNNWLRNNLGA